MLQKWNQNNCNERLMCEMVNHSVNYVNKNYFKWNKSSVKWKRFVGHSSNLLHKLINFAGIRTWWDPGTVFEILWTNFKETIDARNRYFTTNQLLTIPEQETAIPLMICSYYDPQNSILMVVQVCLRSKEGMLVRFNFDLYSSIHSIGLIDAHKA